MVTDDEQCPTEESAPAALRGRALELAGALEKARATYLAALSEQPEDVELLNARAALELDLGHAEVALRCFRRALELDPSSATARQGAIEAARTLEEPRIQHAFESSGPSGQAQPPPVDAADESDGPLVEAHNLETAAHELVSAFAGRETVYARQWTDGFGRSGYSPIDRPFDHEVAKRHLLGKETVGIYPLRLDDTVRWLCLDIDRQKKPGRPPLKGGAPEPGAPDPARATLQRLAATIVKAGFQPLLEDSGSKGFHVWILFETPVPAVLARRVGQALIREKPEVGSRIEVFPKQTRLGDKKLGSLVKLPLGRHQVSGRWCPWVDAAGQPLDASLEPLMTGPRARQSQILGFVEGLSPVRREEPEIREVYDLQEDEEAQTVLRGCAVLRTLVNHARAHRILSAEELSVMTYTLGHLSKGPELLQSCFQGLMQIASPHRIGRRLSGHVMSCPKIRRRLPELTARVGCDCRFEDLPSYPHPLLHLQKPPRPRSDREKVVLHARAAESEIAELLRTLGASK